MDPKCLPVVYKIMCLAAPRLDTRSLKKHPNTKASQSSKHDLYTSGRGWAAVGKQSMARDTANKMLLASASVSFEDHDNYRLSSIGMQTKEMCFRTSQNDHLL